MYNLEPNRTRNQASERPFLVRDVETTLIVRYCADRGEADTQARRLNKAFYPEVLIEDAASSPAYPESGENMVLF
jgi:hypothetical protein